MADTWVERWLARQTQPEVRDRWYRVEHRRPSATEVLGQLTGVPEHPSTLDPFLSRLLRAGVEEGELVLVEEGTGRIAARRQVRPFRRRG